MRGFFCDSVDDDTECFAPVGNHFRDVRIARDMYMEGKFGYVESIYRYSLVYCNDANISKNRHEILMNLKPTDTGVNGLLSVTGADKNNKKQAGSNWDPKTYKYRDISAMLNKCAVSNGFTLTAIENLPPLNYADPRGYGHLKFSQIFPPSWR